MRSIFEQTEDAWIDEMPYVERLYVLCMEIYTCRETRAFSMEEDLYAKLIFVMRSRETCINYSRRPDRNRNPSSVDKKKPALK